MNSFVSIARIVKTHGLRGEVAAEILTDFPERFQLLDRVFLGAAGAAREERLESFRFAHRSRVILKFAGRDRIEEVEELVGCEVRVPESERVVPPEDVYFDSDLEGCLVYQGDNLLGRVDSILKVGESASNLVVVDERDREFMIPLAREFVRRVDVADRRIEVDLPPGLTDLAVDRGPKRG